MEFFVKVFSTALQARMVIFGMHIGDDFLYCVVENQASPSYSSLYLSNFLSFHTLKNAFFAKNFSTTIQARMVIFGMNVDDNLLFCEIEYQPSPAYSSLYLSNFLSFHTLKNEIFHQRFLHNYAS